MRRSAGRHPRAALADLQQPIKDQPYVERPAAYSADHAALKQTDSMRRDNDYAYVREMWPMAPPPLNTAMEAPLYGPAQQQQQQQQGPVDATFQYGGETSAPGAPEVGALIRPMSESDEDNHIYESPTTVRRHMSPHYFELDPKVSVNGNSGNVHNLNRTGTGYVRNHSNS